MKDFFIGLLVGVSLSAITCWYFVTVRHMPGVRHAKDTTATTLRQTADTVEAKLAAWHLTNADIEQELQQPGKVVRRHMREFGTSVADATSDVKITATIKAKYKLDRDLAGAGIVVSTTDRRVTLSGNVSALKLIGRAVGVAYETDGVREVSSTLKVK